jgi:MoCo/4Fe-4S cofactor protein with predicted Tat translocation signal
MSDDERKYFEMHPSGGSSHTNGEEEAEQPLTPIDRPLDLAAVRAKLHAKTGKQYWRTLDELADDPHFDELMHREFPRHASEWDESVDRRNFLKLMSASLAFAGLAGCKSNEQDKIIPYVKQPDGMVLGKPFYFATVMPFGADAIGVLVESHEGRPTNMAGNPDHPSSLGGIDPITQASVLNLYDPDRAKSVTFAGSLRTWSEFSQAAQASAADIKAASGAGFRILTGTITSPTLAEQLQGILKLYPQAKWHQWESAVSDGAREGGKLAFGRYVNTVYRPERAEVILALDSDFLASGPGHLRYMKQFYRRRKLDTDPGVERVGGEMNRLYVAEPTPTVTGSSADHRLPLRASQIDTFARALAAKLGIAGAEGGAALPPAAEKWLEGVAKNLQGHRGSSLVIAGEQQSPEVHAIVHAINAALSNVGNTLYYTDPVEANPVSYVEYST